VTETDLTFQLQKYRLFRWFPKQKQLFFSKTAQTILIKFSNLWRPSPQLKLQRVSSEKLWYANSGPKCEML
jgi:hypothetical protein